MKRDSANRRPGHKNHSPETRTARPGTSREIQLSLDRHELLNLMQDSLEALAVELGLLVASAILENEVTRLCGTRYQRQPGRSHTRYGHQRGEVMIGGQKLPSSGLGCTVRPVAARCRWRPTRGCSPPTPSPKPRSGGWSEA